MKERDKEKKQTKEKINLVPNTKQVPINNFYAIFAFYPFLLRREGQNRNVQNNRHKTFNVKHLKIFEQKDEQDHQDNQDDNNSDTPDATNARQSI
jgi:hypothetical protein